MAHEKNPPMLLQPRALGVSALIGVVGGVFFLFVFPKGSISTLMHQVLSFPGPGAGIALILGPVALVFMLVSSHLGRVAGGALVAALGFSVVYALLAAVLGLPTNEKGMFGSFRFVLGLATSGVVAEGLMILTRRLRLRWRAVVTACCANMGLLVYYWIVIFPHTKGWVSWDAALLLLAMSVVGGLVAGIVGWGISTRLPDFTGPDQRR